MFSKLTALFRRRPPTGYGSALSQLERGRAEEALAGLDALLDDREFSETTRAALLNKRGVALIDLRRRDEALAAFHAALECDPRFAPALTNIGNVFFEDGKTAEAIAQYEDALRADDDYPPAHANLAAAYKRLGRHGDAVRELRRAHRLEARVRTYYSASRRS